MDYEHWSRVVGLNVWTCRKAADMTQAQLAAAVGSTVPAVSRLEAGRHLPTVETLLAIAEALGVDPCRLLKPPKKPADPPRRRK